MASRTEINPENKLLHFLDLNDYGLKDVPPENVPAVKREVTDYLVNEVLRYLDRGESPVEGEGRFKHLNPKYAKKQKNGRTTSNLELEGDLKDSLKALPAEGAFIKFGHEGKEVPKADGHNQLSGKAQTWALKSELPKRRYIPSSNQKFADPITNEIRQIVNEFKVAKGNSFLIDALENASVVQGLASQTTSSASPAQQQAGEFVTIDNFFSDDVIDLLLQDALTRRL